MCAFVKGSVDGDGGGGGGAVSVAVNTQNA